MSGEIKNGNENPQNNDTAAEPAGDTEYTARKKNQKLKRNNSILKILLCFLHEQKKLQMFLHSKKTYRFKLLLCI